MISRAEFIRKWRNHIAGIAVFGHASETREGTIARGARIFDVAQDTELLLARMYDSIVPPEEPSTKSAQNGKPAQSGVANARS